MAEMDFSKIKNNLLKHKKIRENTILYLLNCEALVLIIFRPTHSNILVINGIIG